jgi:AcrR family transcriptional regulator
MTRNEIIKTAFRVWGQELYLTTSLTKLAAELGVSKPALYRHFSNKQTLLDTMYKTFFEDYSAFIKPGYEAALQTGNKKEQLLIIMRAMVDYYARNMESFIFSLFQVYGRRDFKGMGDQLRGLGIDMGKLINGEKPDPYPSLFRFIIATLTFWVAVFYKHRQEEKTLSREYPAEGDIRALINFVEERILGGLGLSADVTEAMDYEELEKRLPHELLDAIEDDGLLKSVAAVVAEAGPWNASMDMVARRSGLSKSGLYAHFKSKQDMIRRLFQTEFERLSDYVEAGNRCSALPEEQFYLTILAIIDYLRSRPEVLVAIDWLRARRFDLDLEVPSRIYQMFSGTGFCPPSEDPDLPEQTAQWIIFLIVNVLMCMPEDMSFSGLSNCGVRKLFRFISLGIGGFKI